MPPRVGRRLRKHLFHAAVDDVDLCLVADVVRHRADQPDGPVPLQMPGQAADPARRYMGVVVQQCQVIALGHGEPLVVRRGEAPVFPVEDASPVRAPAGPFRQEFGRAVAGGVVHHDDFHTLVEAVLIQARKARAGELEVVVRHHDNTHHGVASGRLDMLYEHFRTVKPGLLPREGLAPLDKRGRLRQAQRPVQLCEKLLPVCGYGYEPLELPQFRQVYSHDRFAGAEILVDLDRVRCQGELGYHKRQQADIEAMKVIREPAVRHLACERHIGQPRKPRPGVDRVRAHQQYAAVRMPPCRGLNQLQVEPLGDGAVVPDDPPSQRVPIHALLSSGEMLVVGCVADQHPVPGMRGHCFIQPGGGDDGEVGLFQQPFFQLQQGPGAGAEALVVIHAVIDESAVREHRGRSEPEGMLHQRYDLAAVRPIQDLTRALPEAGHDAGIRRIGVNIQCSPGKELYLEQPARVIQRFGLKTGSFVIHQVRRNVKHPPARCSQGKGHLLRPLVPEMPIDDAPDDVVGPFAQPGGGSDRRGMEPPEPPCGADQPSESPAKHPVVGVAERSFHRRGQRQAVVPPPKLPAEQQTIPLREPVTRDAGGKAQRPGRPPGQAASHEVRRRDRCIALGNGLAELGGLRVALGLHLRDDVSHVFGFPVFRYAGIPDPPLCLVFDKAPVPAGVFEQNPQAVGMMELHRRIGTLQFFPQPGYLEIVPVREEVME